MAPVESVYYHNDVELMRGTFPDRATAEADAVNFVSTIRGYDRQVFITGPTWTLWVYDCTMDLLEAA